MTRSQQRTALVSVILLSLACAPVSWIDDGLTISFVIYPIALLVALWRVIRGEGALFVAIAATIFFLVHLPWTWAALTGAESNPLDRESPSSPLQWLITLCVIPLITAAIGWLIWRQRRAHADLTA